MIQAMLINLRQLQRFIVSSRRNSFFFNIQYASVKRNFIKKSSSYLRRSVNLAFVYSFWALPFTLKPAAVESVEGAKMENLSELLQHADQLFDEDNYEETVKVLKSFNDQEQYDIKWRLARAIFSVSKTAEGKTKKELVQEGYAFAQEALRLKDDDFAGHKWMAILLDAKSGLDGIKERVSQLENVKKHMERAVELNPTDPTSWYILGEFAFGLAELPWYTRKILNTLFATPPTGTFDEALGHFEKAESISPNFYSMNVLLIGKCYYNLNNKEKAREWLTKASEVTLKNDDDKKCKEEALKLLKKV